MTREIGKIVCTCGGEAEEVETTNWEEEQFGCGKKGCCVNAFKCKECNTRFTFALEAPEME